MEVPENDHDLHALCLREPHLMMRQIAEEFSKKRKLSARRNIQLLVGLHMAVREMKKTVEADIEPIKVAIGHAVRLMLDSGWKKDQVQCAAFKVLVGLCRFNADLCVSSLLDLWSPGKMPLSNWVPKALGALCAENPLACRHLLLPVLHRVVPCLGKIASGTALRVCVCFMLGQMGEAASECKAAELEESNPVENTHTEDGKIFTMETEALAALEIVSKKWMPKSDENSSEEMRSASCYAVGTLQRLLSIQSEAEESRFPLPSLQALVDCIDKIRSPRLLCVALNGFLLVLERYRARHDASHTNVDMSYFATVLRHLAVVAKVDVKVERECDRCIFVLCEINPDVVFQWICDNIKYSVDEKQSRDHHHQHHQQDRPVLCIWLDLLRRVIVYTPAHVTSKAFLRPQLLMGIRPVIRATTLDIESQVCLVNVLSAFSQKGLFQQEGGEELLDWLVARIASEHQELHEVCSELLLLCSKGFADTMHSVMWPHLLETLVGCESILLASHIAEALSNTIRHLEAETVGGYRFVWSSHVNIPPATDLIARCVSWMWQPSMHCVTMLRFFVTVGPYVHKSLSLVHGTGIFVHLVEELVHEFLSGPLETDTWLAKVSQILLVIVASVDDDAWTKELAFSFVKVADSNLGKNNERVKWMAVEALRLMDPALALERFGPEGKPPGVALDQQGVPEESVEAEMHTYALE